MSRNYSFEALAEATSTDWTAGRGELNAALKSIREQSEISDDYLLADDIHARAKTYKALMPDVMLTPSALAKHWLRCAEPPKRPVFPNPPPLPGSRREQNLQEARKILEMFK